MSINNEVRASVLMTRAEVMREIESLQSYLHELNRLKQQLNAALEGNSRSEMRIMTAELDQTEENVKKTVQFLKVSVEKLEAILRRL